MRKMTKTVATLAAMSAMTVASASLAFAAEKQVEGLTGGTWSAQANGGWKYKTEAGVQLKDTWAEIDGVWYYFKGDVMAKDRYLVLDDKGYFFDGNGRLATGWQKITSKMDAYSDLSISNDWYYPTNNGYETVNSAYEYDYHDYVWCYFDESGVAKENEWFMDPASGRWYYFDENIMVKNVFNYEVRPDNYDVTESKKEKFYGFDENGAMMTGWNSKKTEEAWNNPTTDGKGDVWYYYKSNGQMQKAGWAEIDGDWYLFANNRADELADFNNGTDKYEGKNDNGEWLYGGFPLVVNSYVASYKNADDVEYFYVDGTGKLQEGVQNVKKAWKVLFYNYDKEYRVAYETLNVENKDIYVNFSDKGFAAKKGVKDNYYYALSNSNIYDTPFGTKASEVTEINNRLYDATALFTNYSTFVEEQWDFTDTGVATTSSTSDDAKYVTSGAYVNNETFATISATTYEGLSSLGKKDYFAMVDTADAEVARDAANAAYLDKNSKASILATKKADWEALLNNTFKSIAFPATVTGYDTDIITGALATEMEGCGNYDALEAKAIAKANLAKNALLAWNQAKENNASAATVDVYKTAYTKAKAIADEYERVCALYKGDMIAEAVSADNSVIYDAYIAAKAAYDLAETTYNNAAQKALTYNYDDFENQWDEIYYTSETDFTVVGERVKNAFIAQDTDKLYMVDGDGKLVCNKAVLIDDDANIIHSDGNPYDNAYLVFGSDGLATVGYTDTKKTISIGGVSYWSTNKTVKIGKATATIFVGDKKLNGHY